MTDDEEPPGVLESLGVGVGETGAADAAPDCSVGLSSAPEKRPSAASVMAQTHKANRVVLSKRTPGST